jgi:serine/threonine protein kinase
MSPEVILKLPHNHKCDIWSIGIILFTMLVGYPPFRGEDEDNVE